MGIAFTQDQWDHVKKTYGAWWEDKLDRPVVPVYLGGRDPGRTQPKAPLLGQENCSDLSIPAADLIDRMDYELSKIHFLGDAFPVINFNSFGPGLAAAFLGARLDNSTGRVWFHPEKLLPVSEIHPKYDPDNIWLERIRELYREGMKRWDGQVLMGIPDIGGSMDILSTLRPSEHLLLDLIDDPEEVKRVNWELHALWHRFYEELSDILNLSCSGKPSRPGEPVNPGWSDWSSAYSASPAYILQCDFCYMISPGMFDAFIKPELAASAKRLGHSVYHLDGIGQLPHLDSLLQIPDIRAIQWVPGDGKPPQEEWPEVWKKVQRAGKGAVLFCGLDGMDRIAETLGTTKGICNMPVYAQAEEETAIRKRLDKYMQR